MPSFLPTFHPAGWLHGRHVQTIYPALCLKERPPPYRREIWSTPDGDEIAVDRLVNEAAVDAPLVVHFHGLEGSSTSHYATALMHTTARRGWHGAVAHFRGCGGHSNQRARAYHAGDSAEIDWILRRFRAEHGGPLLAAGVSLGGNALAKWLGEQGEAARLVAAAAAVISAPLDLTAAGMALDKGFNRQVYTRAFLHSLRPKTLGQLARFEAEMAHLQVSRQDILRARTFKQFDNQITAPLHGFADVHDYWRRASAKPLLVAVRVPTLVVNARNDPFVPAASLPSRSDVSAAVTLLQPEQGGHVGFVSGSFPGHIRWLPEVQLGFFARAIGLP